MCCIPTLSLMYSNCRISLVFFFFILLFDILGPEIDKCCKNIISDEALKNSSNGLSNKSNDEAMWRRRRRKKYNLIRSFAQRTFDFKEAARFSSKIEIPLIEWKKNHFKRSRRKICNSSMREEERWILSTLKFLCFRSIF